VEEGVVEVEVDELMLMGRRKERSGAEVLLGMYAVSKGRGQWAGSGRRLLMEWGTRGVVQKMSRQPCLHPQSCSSSPTCCRHAAAQ
jgi:hypothetical protein